MTYPTSNLRTANYDTTKTQIDDPQLNGVALTQDPATRAIIVDGLLLTIAKCSGIPVGICGGASTSIGNNGALTGLTALPTQFPKIYLYFAANVLFSGSTAGFYYAEMSSTSAATVYNNLLDPLNPAWPITKTPIVATGPGAFTQVTASNVVVQSFTVPANTLGPNGHILVEHLMSISTSGSNKTADVRLGGSVLDGSTATTQNSARYLHTLYNSGDTGKQAGGNFLGVGANASTITRRTVDTTVDQLLTLNFTMSASTDYMISEGRTISVYPGV